MEVCADRSVEHHHDCDDDVHARCPAQPCLSHVEPVSTDIPSVTKRLGGRTEMSGVTADAAAADGSTALSYVEHTEGRQRCKKAAGQR